jgi:hypothetical protein
MVKPEPILRKFMATIVSCDGHLVRCGFAVCFSLNARPEDLGGGKDA